jgi:hypothetical protein
MSKRENTSIRIKDIFTQIHVIHPKTKSREFLFPNSYRYAYSSFLIGKLKEIVIMGGAVRTGGNVTPYAEFNIFSDPLAAQIVLESAVSKPP